MGLRIRSGKMILPQEAVEALVKKYLIKPESVPNGDEEDFLSLDYRKFSDALEAAVVQRLLATADLKDQWYRAQPVAIGSWARHELTPKSDLDIIFLGDAIAAGSLTRIAQEAGIPLRARVPEDIHDLSKGVQDVDTLALFDARPLTEERGAVHFVDETLGQKFGASRLREKRKVLLTLKHERGERQKRFDSLAGFLEPNLKYGPGGLRDIHQARLLRLLYPKRFLVSERKHALDIYEYYRRFFLYCRTLCQITEGGGDILNAHVQPLIAQWFGYASLQDFMKEVQKGLQRVSFYTDIDYTVATSSERKLKIYEREALDFQTLARWLREDPSPLNQAKARDHGFRLFRKCPTKDADKILRDLIVQGVDPREPDTLIVALFKSRWMDIIIPEYKKLVGLVQHDQYHCYTVDTHLLQAIREVKRVYRHPTILGRFKKVVLRLTDHDWVTLGWAALFHDIGKGGGYLKSKGQNNLSHHDGHSERSVQIAKRDLEKWGMSKDQREDILWLIANHLELSRAAFRGNPASTAMWRELHAKGIEGRRLRLLALFTCIDILATNRTAYTPWKERLLFDLVQNLETKEATSLSRLEKVLRAKPKANAKSDLQFLDILNRLDPFVVASIPVRTLALDLENLRDRIKSDKAMSEKIEVKIIPVKREHRVWLRFFSRVDRAGIFLQIAHSLQAVGLSVRHASLLSDAEIGVYDWIEVKPPRSLKGLETRLERLLQERVSLDFKDKKTFDHIELLSQTDDEWSISFRARDFRGALLSATEAIVNCGLSIKWAKVHTWGSQIDDVFGVIPLSSQSPDECLAMLKRDLQT